VGEAGDVRLAVSAVFVAHGDVADAQAHECRAEEEVEIPEGVEVAEFWQAFQQPFVVAIILVPQRLSLMRWLRTKLSALAKKWLPSMLRKRMAWFSIG